MKSTQSKRVRQDGSAWANAQQAPSTPQAPSRLSAADATLLQGIALTHGRMGPAVLCDMAGQLDAEVRGFRRAADLVMANPDAYDLAERAAKCSKR